LKKNIKLKHQKEFDTQTLVTPIEQLADTSNEKLADTQIISDLKELGENTDTPEDKKTQPYEPRPLTPDDEIYDDIIEQFQAAPTKPKYWFEEFGDSWSCSCGTLNEEGDTCSSCGLERDLLRSLFILHKPEGTKSNHLQIQPIKDSRSKKLYGKTKRNLIIAVCLCIILIIGCSLPLYIYLTGPAPQYSEAGELMAGGQYEKAITKYESLGDYKDSKELIRDCYIKIGDKQFETTDYEAAIETYTTAADLEDSEKLQSKIRECYISIGNKQFENNEFKKAITSYSAAADITNSGDIQEKIHNCKFEYVKKYMSERTSEVEKYMSELMAVKYPGIEEIYDEYYAWHVSIIANTSETDFSSDKNVFSRKETVYFHTSLGGGEPNETLTLYYEVVWPDGASEIYTLDSTWKDGSNITARFQYPIPLFGKEGQLTFKLYNKSTNELMGSDSITFKN